MAEQTIEENGQSPRKMPIFAGGFGAAEAEAEFMLRISVPEPDAALPTTDEETIRWLAEIRVGIEIASSPYALINAEGPLVPICDHGNNFGLVLGPQIPRDNWLDLNSIEAALDIAGEQVGAATAAAMLDGPLGAVRFLLQNMASRGIAPQSGWWISTGAVTGVHPVSLGQAGEARFAGLGSVHCVIAAVP